MLKTLPVAIAVFVTLLSLCTSDLLEDLRITSDKDVRQDGSTKVLSVSRTVETTGFGVSGSLLVSGPGAQCHSKDQYGSNDCDLVLDGSGSHVYIEAQINVPRERSHDR